MMNTIVNPYLDFNEKEMEEFYAKKQFLACMDATELLKTCIFSREEERHYTGTYRAISRGYYVPSINGARYRDTEFIEEYTSETTILISTSLLMDKLDATMFYWRKLNPELVNLLTSEKLVELEVISNWVKMIHYLTPNNQQCIQESKKLSLPC